MKGKTPAFSRRSGFFRTSPEKRPNGICRWDRDCPDGLAVVPSRRKGGDGDPRRVPTPADLPWDAGCGVVFWICCHCDRGHRYCGERCRQKTQRQQGRDANRRHQQSQEGRLDHRDRQRDYRERCRRRVTDHTSATPFDSDSIVTAEAFPVRGRTRKRLRGGSICHQRWI